MRVKDVKVRINYGEIKQNICVHLTDKTQILVRE